MPLSGCFGPVWSSPIPASSDYVDQIYSTDNEWVIACDSHHNVSYVSVGKIMVVIVTVIMAFLMIMIIFLLFLKIALPQT